MSHPRTCLTFKDLLNYVHNIGRTSAVIYYFVVVPVTAVLLLETAERLQMPGSGKWLDVSMLHSSCFRGPCCFHVILRASAHNGTEVNWGPRTNLMLYPVHTLGIPKSIVQNFYT